MDLSEKRLFLLDMDGTLYLGDRLLPGAREFLDWVPGMGGRYYYLTNNSSRGAAAYLAKLAKLGLPAAKEDFLTSADAAVDYLQTHKTPQDVYYVCGTESFQDQLRQAGAHLADRPEAAVTTLICGFDTELTFRKLEDACILLGRGVDFLATNPDWVCPTEFGYVPDCGSVCEMLYRATGRRPKVLGKPEPEMVLLALKRSGFRPEEALLVGDRLYTDIACGVRAGIDTALVLCGESTVQTLEQSAVKPSAVFRDVAELLERLREAN